VGIGCRPIMRVTKRGVSEDVGLFTCLYVPLGWLAVPSVIAINREECQLCPGLNLDIYAQVPKFTSNMLQPVFLCTVPGFMLENVFQ